MADVLFCPVTFNLAETTRMIQVARALDPIHHPVFMGYEDDYVSLIVDAGFEYRACAPSWSAAERRQAIAFDQGRALRTPFTAELVTARVDVERRLIRELAAPVVVTGSNLTSYISARAEKVPLFYPVPFALTLAQVQQTTRMEFIRGRGWPARAADRVATSTVPLDLHARSARPSVVHQGREDQRRSPASHGRVAADRRPEPAHRDAVGTGRLSHSARVRAHRADLRSHRRTRSRRSSTSWPRHPSP